MDQVTTSSILRVGANMRVLSVSAALAISLLVLAAPGFGQQSVATGRTRSNESSVSLVGGVWHCTSYVTVAPGAGRGGGEQNPFDVKFNSDGTYSFVGSTADPEQILTWRQNGSDIEVAHTHDYHSTERGTVTSPTQASFSHEYIRGFTTTDTCERHAAPAETAQSNDRQKPPRATSNQVAAALNRAAPQSGQAPPVASPGRTLGKAPTSQAPVSDGSCTGTGPAGPNCQIVK